MVVVLRRPNSQRAAAGIDALHTLFHTRAELSYLQPFCAQTSVAPRLRFCGALQPDTARARSATTQCLRRTKHSLSAYTRVQVVNGHVSCVGSVCRLPAHTSRHTHSRARPLKSRVLRALQTHWRVRNLLNTNWWKGFYAALALLPRAFCAVRKSSGCCTTHNTLAIQELSRAPHTSRTRRIPGRTQSTRLEDLIGTLFLSEQPVVWGDTHAHLSPARDVFCCRQGAKSSHFHAAAT